MPREKSDERMNEKIQVIKESGTKIISLDETTYEQMQAASKSVYEKIARTADGEIINLYMKE